MNRNRPTVVLVMGILSIVLGSLGLICSLCGASNLLLQKSASTFAAGVPGAEKSILAQQEIMDREIPNYMTLQLTGMAIATLFATLLLLGGIGLIFMRKWGRWCCILYALITPPLQIAGLWWRITKVTPAEMKAQKEAMKNVPGGGNQPQLDLNMDLFGTIVNVAISVVVALVIIYAIVLLTTMLLPRVKRAFAGTAAGAGDNQDYRPF
jgi:hypothetical protein